MTRCCSIKGQKWVIKKRKREKQDNNNNEPKSETNERGELEKREEFRLIELGKWGDADRRTLLASS